MAAQLTMGLKYTSITYIITLNISILNVST